MSYTTFYAAGAAFTFSYLSEKDSVFLTIIGKCGAFPVRWISCTNSSSHSDSGMRLRLLSCDPICIRPGPPNSVFSSYATTAGVDDWPRTSDRSHIRAELYLLSYINTLLARCGRQRYCPTFFLQLTFLHRPADSSCASRFASQTFAYNSNFTRLDTVT